MDHFQYVHSVLPSFFDRNCASLFSNNIAGGCIIAWKQIFQLLNSWTTKHTVYVILKHTGTGMIFIVTNVYGPSVKGQKWQFINEIRSLHRLVQHRWILLGDFSLVRWYIDRSSQLRGFTLMSAFNALISDLELQDIQLDNRSYTWSSKRPHPLFSRLDRIMLTTQWTASYPIIKMRAMKMLVSDHVSLVLTCARMQTKRGAPLIIESFWLKYKEANDIILKQWLSSHQSSQNAARRFGDKTRAVQEALRSWHRSNYSQIK